MVFGYFLILMLIFIMLFILYMSFEASWLQINRLTRSKGKNSLKIIQLSDIHINHLAVSARAVKRIIERENPDVIIFTGDYVERKKDVKSYFAFHKEIVGNRRSIACMGNHDYNAFPDDKKSLDDFTNEINKTGTSLLVNSTVCFDKGGKKYSFTGIDDIRAGVPDIDRALSEVPADAYLRIGLAHNPDTILDIPFGKLDYLFCGHFHGGQMWAPFNIEFRLLRKDQLCKKGFKRGLHKINGIILYINRGLGGVLVPLRFLSRPEITIITLP